MPLINCPNCGKQISDRAEDCVHCGYSFNQPKIGVNDKNTDNRRSNKSSASSSNAPLYIGLLVLSVPIYIILWFSGIFDEYLPNHDYPTETVQQFMNNCKKVSSQEVCSCMLEKVQKEYSHKKFLIIRERLNAGELNPYGYTQYIIRAAIECN